MDTRGGGTFENIFKKPQIQSRRNYVKTGVSL
jgi:hypothetical protein